MISGDSTTSEDKLDMGEASLNTAFGTGALFPSFGQNLFSYSLKLITLDSSEDEREPGRCLKTGILDVFLARNLGLPAL